MLRKLVVFPIVVVMVFTMSFVMPFGETIVANAGVASDLADVNKEKKEAKANLENKKAAEAKIDNSIAALEARIKKNESAIETLKKNIEKTIASIAQAEQDIIRMEGELAQQNADLGERLRLMYENGDASLIEVLVGSTSFVDFMSNLEMIQVIHAFDMKVLDEIDAKLRKIEKKKADLDQMKIDLEADKAEQEELKVVLAADKKTLAAAKEKAHAETAHAQEDLAALQAASDRLEAELAAMQKAGQTYNQPYGGGSMKWPANGPLTSYFGYRNDTGGVGSTNHMGIDIGCSYGSPIWAAADGRVTISTYYGGYGNAVVIDHGSGITTLYGHNSTLLVSVGQIVSRGDLIAYAGSTGNSTGPHCHFEVRVYGSAQNPLNGWLE